MDWIFEYLGEVAVDFLNALKEFLCWAIHTLLEVLTSTFELLVESLPGHGQDTEVAQQFINEVHVWNELLPVVEFCGMWAAYIAFRVAWGAFRLVIYFVPTVGGA